MTGGAAGLKAVTSTGVAAIVVAGALTANTGGAGAVAMGAGGGGAPGSGRC